MTSKLLTWTSLAFRALPAVLFASIALSAISTLADAQEFLHPNPMAFTKTSGEADPVPQVLSIGGDRDFYFTAEARTSSGGRWLMVSPGGKCCITPGGLVVTVKDPDSLPEGTYKGEIAVGRTTGPAMLVPVTLTVSPKQGTFPDKSLSVPLTNPSASLRNLWPSSTSNVVYGQFNTLNTGFGQLATAPDGSNSAILIFEANPSSGAVPHNEYLYTSLGAGQHTLSFHFKTSGDSFAYIGSTVDTVEQRVWFNLANGTVGTNTFPGSTAQITALAGGWYRCSITFTVTTDAFYSGFGLSNADGVFQYTAAPPNGVYEWGQQFENGTLTPYQAVPTVLNTTRIADTGFVVGDTWQADVAGGPNQTVIVNGTYNGTPWSAPVGQTNTGGYFSLGGTMVGGQVGNWTETWLVGGVQVGPTSVFTVFSQPTVQFTNLTRPGNTSNLQLGDNWRIDVAGRPNQPVSVSGTFNGTPWGAGLGSTDGNGNFSLSGTISAGTGGNWSETWSVGGVQAAPIILFTVAPTVQITNLTHPGNSTNFLVGDSWRINVAGIPNQPVSVNGTFNGAPWGTNLGSTDGSGNFSFSGTMSAGTTGNWTETWSVGGTQATPVLSFTVSPTVQIANLTHPGNTSSLAVGDNWQITVAGRPNQPVSVTGTFNGTPWGASVGQTDGNGNFTLNGTMAAGQTGNWTETWSVAGTQATPVISFSVH